MEYQPLDGPLRSVFCVVVAKPAVHFHEKQLVRIEEPLFPVGWSEHFRGWAAVKSARRGSRVRFWFHQHFSITRTLHLPELTAFPNVFFRFFLAQTGGCLRALRAPFHRLGNSSIRLVSRYFSFIFGSSSSQTDALCAAEARLTEQDPRSLHTFVQIWQKLQIFGCIGADLASKYLFCSFF